MFQTLTQNLTKIFDKIKSTGTLTEGQIDASMRDIRIALLEADVALPVVREFIASVKEKAQGQEIVKSISPAQMIIKIINDEIINLLAPDATEAKLNLSSTPPANILIVGLQGSGKTTASAKLALRLKKQNKKVLLVSLDTYRPAAQDQLQVLANDIEVDSLEIIKGQKPLEITNRALKEAKLSGYDIVIYDSAGRLHIDEEMISEVSTIKKMVAPTETLLVIDSMIGQDAVTVASTFNEKLTITGVVLSRIDGDSRGGAALSVRHVTGKPIKFLSTGEKPADFEEFDAKRIASRILDMGDIVSLVEKAASVIDQKEAEKTAARLKKGKFDLDDYISQIKTIKKLGGFGSMMSMIPGMSKFSDKIGDAGANDKMLNTQVSIVLSMTKKERRNPDILNASRRKRIATGSGTTVQQINTLLKQFKQISTMMKKAAKMDPKSMMRSGLGKLFS
ncbi:MAG: signal recognition particle protein [Rickettsiaceae bacterium]|nr:signal recognition particle protein [Rickettsiaceae bacterium]MDP4832438.1 signal recognition particle protein [Rickettsiaceae bacterium]MDP5020426.1 signal recognition particle protein [Rickettsiaceae bacterium]MDP5083540.1 signal recognition particle protein [Rickettsiaceae bacterium]